MHPRQNALGSFFFFEKEIKIRLELDQAGCYVLAFRSIESLKIIYYK